MNKIKPYNYINFQSDIKSLIHLISLHGTDLVGLELGTSSGDSFITMLQNCPNIKTLYGVDAFMPHVDNITYDERQSHYVDEKKCDFLRINFYHNVKYSGYQDKVIFFEGYSKDALEGIDDESLDFIFIDTCSSYENALEDLSLWYPKVKPGGIFSGHDIQHKLVQDAVNSFRVTNNIDNQYSTYDNVWVWYK